MQLASKFFINVTILEHISIGMQYWHARMRTWAMLLFLVTLKIFNVCTVTMGVACPLLQRSIYVIVSTCLRGRLQPRQHVLTIYYYYQSPDWSS